MGLFDQYKTGGLFSPDAQAPVDSYAPTQPQKRGGFLGSGYDGEDIMSMLLRAAAIAQGDLGAGAQFGSNIGARARAAAAEAAKRQNDFADWQQRQDYIQSHQGPPPMVRDLEAYRHLDPEQLKAYREQQALLHPQFVTGKDGLPYQTNAAPLDPNEWEPYSPTGGGAGNGTGGFP